MRGHEAAVAPQARTSDGQDDIVARLLDDTGAVLVATTPVVAFPAGCSPRATRPGMGLLRVALARHPSARQVELSAHGRVIFTAPIGLEPPAAPAIVLEAAPASAVVRLRIEPPPQPADDVRFFVVDETRRRLPVTPTLDDGRPAIDLAAYAGRGRARIAVEITRQLRTATAQSPPTPLPPTPVRGRILEPRDQSEWCANVTGSLIANLSDDNGRAIPWDAQKITWAVDGHESNDTRQVAVREALDPGAHGIELHYRHPDGRAEVLDRVEITIRVKTSMEKAYDALISDFLASESEPRPEQPPVAPPRTRSVTRKAGCGCGGH